MNRSFLHACLLTLPLVVGVFAAVWGAEVAGAGALAAGVLVGHLLVFDRLLSLVFGAHSRAEVVPLMAARLPVTLGLGAALVLVLGPVPATAAVACVVGGAVLYAAVDALHRADADAAAHLGGALGPMESRC